EVGVVAHPVDQSPQERSREVFQRVVPQIRGAQFERGDSQSVTALVGQVGDETCAFQFGEQVIRARSRQVEFPGDRGGRDRTGVLREYVEYGQPASQRGNIATSGHIRSTQSFSNRYCLISQTSV